MLKQFEKLRKAENRTRSELVREALRTYFDSRFPVVDATKAELAAIRRGRAAFRRSDYISLDQLFHDMDAPGHRPRTKRLSQTADKRPGTR